MGFAVGTQLGAFRITGQIGRGGMGEVYRATDTKLGRDVAIKTVRGELADDADRLARLEREAKFLASLNHAHVAAIYDFSEHEGTRYIAMEFVEGDTLAQKLQAGPLDVEAALQVALQIAEALEAAHSKGLVHRDLKPGNIVVSRDGVAKVLDFGLAKWHAVDATDTALPSTLTQAGTIQGTPAFMSPEQVRGEEADAQADIWAFGCVLFETLSGVPAFQRATVAETIARVLEAEPDFSALPDNCPVSIRRLLRRCLKKSARARIHHIGDARIEILDALDGASDPALPGAAAGRSSRWQIAAGFAAGAIIAAAGLLAWTGTETLQTPAAAPVYFSFTRPIPTLTMTGARFVAISPNARRLAYVAGDQLFEGALGESGARAVASGLSPFYRDDGAWLGYADASVIWKLPLSGAVPEEVTPYGGRFLGADWHGDTIVFATSEGLFRVSDRSGSTPERLLPSDGSQWYAWPQFAGDSESIVLSIVPSGEPEASRTAWLDLDTLEPVIVGRGLSPHLLPGNVLVAAVGGSLEAVRLDAQTHAAIGTPTTVTEAIYQSGATYGATSFAISESGTLFSLEVRAMGPATNALLWHDTVTNEEQRAADPGSYGAARISPDGTRIAVEAAIGGTRTIAIYDAEDGNLIETTGLPGFDNLWVAWRDDERLCWGVERARFEIYCGDVGRAAGFERLIDSQSSLLPWSVAGDGTVLVFNTELNNPDIGVVTASEPRELRWILNDENYREISASLSPAHDLILYQSDEVGDTPEVFIRPYPDVEERRVQLTNGGGNQPTWGPATDAGRLIYYQDAEGNMWQVEVRLTDTIEVLNDTRSMLFENNGIVGFGGSFRVSYDVSPRDGRFLIMRRQDDGSAPEAEYHVTVNWAQTLETALR